MLSVFAVFAVFAEPPHRALKSVLQLVRRTGDSLTRSRRLARHRNGLPSLKAGFHDALFIILAMFSGIFVGDMNFDARDVRAKVAERFGDRSFYVCHECLVPFNIMAGVDLNFHASCSLLK